MPKRPRRQKSIVDSASVLNAGPFHVVGGLHKEEEKSGSSESGTAVERHDDLPSVCYREYDENVTASASDDVHGAPDILHEEADGSDLTTIKTEPVTADYLRDFSVTRRVEDLIEQLQKKCDGLLRALTLTYELAMRLNDASEDAARVLMMARWTILQAEGKMR